MTDLGRRAGQAINLWFGALDALVSRVKRRRNPEVKGRYHKDCEQT